MTRGLGPLNPGSNPGNPIFELKCHQNQKKIRQQEDSEHATEKGQGLTLPQSRRNREKNRNALFAENSGQKGFPKGYGSAREKNAGKNLHPMLII